MATMVEARSPIHLWVVGVVALLWNAYGCYDYWMTVTANSAYLSQFAAEQIAYWEGLPGWLTGFWALGVWGGLAGALLLLFRSRHAVLAFALSLLGTVVTFGYQFVATDMPASMKEGAMAVMPWVIMIVAAAFYYYAHRQKQAGALR